MNREPDGPQFPHLGVKVDADADAAYIALRAPVEGEHWTTNIMVDDERLKGYVVLDVDVAGRLVGIELLGISELIG